MTGPRAHVVGRWFLGLVSACALVCLAVLVDRPLAGWAARLDETPLDHVARAISAAVRVEVPLALVAAVVLAGAVKRRPALVRLAIHAILLVVVAAFLAEALKPVFGRARPTIEHTDAGPQVRSQEDRTNAMPSGHTLAAFALAGALSVGVGRWRWALYGGAGLVGLSRVVVVAHWPSDVAVGAFLGLALGWLWRRFPQWPRFRLAGRLLAPSGRDEGAARLVGAVVVLGLALPLFLVGSERIPLIDPHEPRAAQAAREMVQRGDFVVPRFAGEYRLEPPLSTWAMCGSYAVFGQGRFAARFPSAAFGAAACLLTYAIGLRLFDRRTAFAGAVILVCSPQLVIAARSAAPDAALLALTLGAFYAALRLGEDGRPLLWVPVLYGCLGLSNLAKGPAGIAVFGLAMAAYLVATRDRRFLRRLHVVMGLLIVAAVTAPWLILVGVRTQGTFLRMIGDHLLAYAVGGKDGYDALFLVYIPLLAAFFFPWSALLPRAFGRAWRQRRDVPAAWFLLWWALTGFVLFCAIGTRLPHYLLPLYPALSLLVAKSLMVDADADRGPLSGRLWLVGAAFLVVVSAGAAGAAPAVIARSGFPLISALVAGFVGVLLTVGVVAAICLMRRRHVLSGFGALAAGAYIAWLGTFHLVLPRVVAYDLAEIVAPALEARRREGRAVAALGYTQPSLVWRVPGLRLLESGDDLARFAQRRPGGACLMPMRVYRRWRRDGRLSLAPLGYYRGFNFAKWAWVDTCLAEATPKPAAAVH